MQMANPLLYQSLFLRKVLKSLNIYIIHLYIYTARLIYSVNLNTFVS